MTPVKRPNFLASLRTLLLWILKCGPVHRIVAWIILRLSAPCHSLSVFLGRNRGRRPPTSQNEDSVLKNTKIKPNNDLDHQATSGEDKRFHTPLPFIMDPDGEIVSLDNVSYSVSLYPNSGHIRDANRSAQSLNASIKSHESAVSNRIALRSRETFATRSRSPSPSPTQLSIHSRNSASSTSGIDSPPRSTSPSMRLEPITKRPLPEQLRLPSRTLSQPPDIDIIDPIGTRLAVPTTPDDVPPVYFNQPLIAPVMPEATQRYHRRPRIQRNDTSLKIPPKLTDFSQPAPPPEWRREVHPEGARYFRHREKADADLDDSKILRRAREVLTLLDEFITEQNLPLPESLDLVIDVFYKRKVIHATYYYVDHQTRCIFFLDDFSVESMSVAKQLFAVNTYQHLRHEIEAQYWFFLQLYPCCLELSTSQVHEFNSIVLHHIGDCMSSPYSTSPFKLENLYKLLEVSNALESNAGEVSPGSMSFLGRFLYIFHHTRCLNYYGEPHARLERTFSVHGDAINPRSWLIKSISMFLFFAPEVHLLMLQRMWVDGVLHKSVWEEAFKRMNDEWASITFLATVILSATVSFLNISGITNNKNSLPYIFSCISIAVTIGSIILGLLLKRQHQTKIIDTMGDIQKILHRWDHPYLGLETLAILYSLPYALVMWGTLSFLLACCAMFFQGGGILTYSMIGCVCVILAALILWSIVASWEAVVEDKPIPPCPERQADNGTINVDSHWLPAPEHGDAINLRLRNSPEAPCQSAQSSFLTTLRRSHDFQESTV